MRKLCQNVFGAVRIDYRIFAAGPYLYHLPYMRKAERCRWDVRHKVIQVSNDLEFFPSPPHGRGHNAPYHPRAAKAVPFHGVAQLGAMVPYIFVAENSHGRPVRIARDHGLSDRGVCDERSQVFLQGLPNPQKSTVSQPNGFSHASIRFGGEVQIVLPICRSVGILKIDIQRSAHAFPCVISMVCYLYVGHSQAFAKQGGKIHVITCPISECTVMNCTHPRSFHSMRKKSEIMRRGHPKILGKEARLSVGRFRPSHP